MSLTMKKKGSTLVVALAAIVLTTTLVLLAAPVAPVAQAQSGVQQYGAQYPPEAQATGGGSSGGQEDDELATLSFELLVEGTPPAGTAFYGSVPVEGSFDTRVPLSDPDGDGLYTGSTTINRFGPGPRPIPAGTEPVSLPIKILQGESVIKDFGVVKIDGDKTFSASVSFGDDPGGGQEVSANGIVEGPEVTSYGYGTHALINGGTPIYALESQSVDLDDHVGKSATIYGTLVPGYENGLAGGPPLVEVSRVVEAATPPPDDGGTYGFQGTVTSISGSTVLVEEDPSSEGSGDKGYFTVTDETEIGTLVGGDALAPASFEDLAVGQQVEATYAGAVAESYPTQGNAASLVILGEGAGGQEETATLSFELTVKGQPPADAAFSGLVLVPGGVGGLSAPLTDPDGDGLYAGSMEVARYGPGPRPVPPGTEPMSVPVQIVQSPSSVIKDFGLVKLDGDKTFSASVSFGDGGGGTNPGGNNPGGTNPDGIDPGGTILVGSDNGGTSHIGTNPGATGDGASANGSANSGGSGGGQASGGGGSGPGGISVLPATGGTLPVLGIAAAGAALLIGGGLLVRRLAR